MIDRERRLDLALYACLMGAFSLFWLGVGIALTMLVH